MDASSAMEEGSQSFEAGSESVTGSYIATESPADAASEVSDYDCINEWDMVGDDAFEFYGSEAMATTWGRRRREHM